MKNQEIGSRNRKKHFKKMRPLLITSFITCLISIQPSLCQVKSGTSDKTDVERASKNSIIIHQEIDFKATPATLSHFA